MYSRQRIVDEVQIELAKNPRKSLNEIAQAMKIGRHTIIRALAERGHDFRTLRTQMTVCAVRRLLYYSPSLTKKEIAFKLGFSSASAFSHFLRRCETDVDGGVAGPVLVRTGLPAEINLGSTLPDTKDLNRAEDGSERIRRLA